MTDSLTRRYLTRIMLPIMVIAAVTLAAAVLIARQFPHPVIVTTLQPARFGSSETIGIFDPGRRSFELRILLPDSFRQVAPRIISKRYVAYTQLIGPFGERERTQVLLDLFTGRELTHPTMLLSFGQISPDGTLMTAATSRTQTSNTNPLGGLMIVDLAAWETRIIADDVPSRPMWSQDNRLVYYADGSFYITDPGATNPRPVTERAFTAYNNYLLSPDGNHIAILGTEANSEVDGFTPRLIDIATGDVQATAAAAPDTTTAAIFWSPDGRHLLTVRGAPNRLDVSALDVATGSARTLSTELPGAVPVQIGGIDPALYYNPTINSGWDSTGRRLVVWVVTNFNPYNGHLMLIDLAAETLTLFGEGAGWAATWSPDDRYVLAEVWSSGAVDASQPGVNLYAMRQRVPEHAATLASPSTAATMYWLPGAPHTFAYIDPVMLPSPLTLLDVASGRDTVLADDTMQLLYVER